ncbi:hypothetical protein D3C77_780490 [compost metagenome]
MMTAASLFESRIIVNDITFVQPEDAESTLIIYVDCHIIQFMIDTTLEVTVDMNNT